MPKRSKRPRRGAGRSTSPAASPGHWVGAGLLTVAAANAGYLSAERLAAIRLPGCGPGSSCASLAASAWGRVPGLEWPIAFLGLAYCVAMLVAWLGARGVDPIVRNVARAAALFSLIYMGVMAARAEWCPYCVAVHACNLAFWILVERTDAGPFAPRPLLGAAATFAATTLALGGLRSGLQREELARAEQRLAESTRQIEARLNEQGPAATAPANEPLSVAPAAPRTLDHTGVPVAATTATFDAPAAGESPEPTKMWPEGFTGRYRRGPGAAPIRIVAFTDYECRLCGEVEPQLEALVRERKDVSLSLKHFPMCTDCNRHAVATLHPGACRAARAAEAAGVLGGAAGFWRVHDWLMERHGAFSTAELDALVASMGIEPDRFRLIMHSQRTREPVERDVEEGMAVGLHYTPMVFINGVELKGWNAPNAIRRTVERLAELSPPARSAYEDRPPLALEKFITDWQASPAQSMPQAGAPYGPAEASLRVAVFGDFEETNTRVVDGLIRDIVDGRSDVNYSFHYFPFDKACNAFVSDTRFQLGCLAAHVAETAKRAAGPRFYWRVHAWLFANQTAWDRDKLRAGVAGMGVDADSFFHATADPQVSAAVQADIVAARKLGVTQIPTVFIAGKLVPRWSRQGESVLEQIVEQAAAGHLRPEVSGLERAAGMGPSDAP